MSRSQREEAKLSKDLAGVDGFFFTVSKRWRQFHKDGSRLALPLLLTGKAEVFMKSVFMSLVMVLSFSTAQAGVEMFDSNEFNAIISDSLKAETDLREQLRENAGVPNLKEELNPDFSKKGRQLVGTVEAENVASPTSDYKQAGKDRSQKRLMEKNMKRVSQEIQDLDLSN